MSVHCLQNFQFLLRFRLRQLHHYENVRRNYLHYFASAFCIILFGEKGISGRQKSPTEITERSGSKNSIRHHAASFRVAYNAATSRQPAPTQNRFRPSVSSMFVPHGSLMNAIEMLSASTLRYATVSGMPSASSFFVNASRFFTSKPM